MLQFQVAAWQAGRQKELADSSFVLLRTEAICYFGRRSLLLAKNLGRESYEATGSINEEFESPNIFYSASQRLTSDQTIELMSKT